MKVAIFRGKSGAGNPHIRSLLCRWLACGGFAVCVAALATTVYAAEAEDVLHDAKPRCWWWWFGDTVTTNGITHDLQAMKEMGLGGASICANHWMGFKPGPVKCLSDEWYDCIVWAGKEADRLELELGFHNCPGWCNTGGPWVRPEFAQKRLVWSETRLEGGRDVDLVLPKVRAPFGIRRKVATLAVPDRENAVTFGSDDVQSTTNSWTFVFAAPRPVAGAVFTVEGTVDRTFPMSATYADFIVSVSDDGVRFREHARHDGVSLEPTYSLAFPLVTAKAVRVAYRGGFVRLKESAGHLVRAEFSVAPRLPHFGRKTFATVKWDGAAQVRDRRDPKDVVVIRPDEIVDLTDRVDADGRLRWLAPTGSWLVLDFSATVMDDAINHFTTPSGTGLECDKMSKAGVEEGARGPVTRIPELVKKHGIRAFTSVHIDSSEVAPQNWTEAMPEEFARRRGYDLRRYLPAMTGRYVGTVDVSERFLRDFRHTVSDLIVDNWGGHYAKIIHGKGLQFELQPYDWVFSQLRLGSVPDIPMSEFWFRTPAWHDKYVHLVACIGDLYGRRIVSSEAFTDAPPTSEDPNNEDVPALRRRGDRMFAYGANRFVIHAYTHQPYDDPAMRTNYWKWGVRIDRHSPHFNSFKPWIAYLTAAQAKLQRGRGVADALRLVVDEPYLSPDDWNDREPFGYRSDVIEREYFLAAVEFSDGRLRLPSGMDYRVLALPQASELSPAVLKKTLALAEAGAEVVLGPRPIGSPSLSGYPACDAEVETLAKKLWDACPEKGSARVGKGRVWRGVDTTAVYAAIGLKPDFAATEAGRPVGPKEVVYTHRVDGTTNVYFIANVTEKPKRLTVTFRSGETCEIQLDGSSSVFVER